MTSPAANSSDHFSSAVEARFWAKVDRRGGDECWPWIGAKNAEGYGKIRIGGRRGRTVLAHRISLGLKLGRVPECWALHHCDNPSCVNPSHLYDGNYKDNIRDMCGRGRHHKAKVTHCPKGHPYDGENLRVVNSGGKRRRVCRTCQTADSRARYYRGRGGVA